MAMKRYINPVQDNQDKYKTYKEQMERYRKAMKAGFFFEGLLIDYAMIEDRMRSYIYHMGLIDDRSKPGLGKKKKAIRPIMIRYEGGNEDVRLGITNLSGKMKIVRHLLEWASETTEDLKKEPYLKALKSQIEGMDVDGLLSTLEEIEEWKDYRNEIIHALLNKNLESVQEELAQRVEQGMKLARFLDKELRKLKKGNKVRSAAGLEP